MDIQTLKKLGREKFGSACRVCPVCDGRACAGEIPGMGGVGSARSFKNNLLALENVMLNQKIVHNAVDPDTGTELFGIKMAAPVIIAPIGGISYNCNDFTPEEDYAMSIVGGANDSGCLAMTGDGPVDIIYESGIAAVKKAGGRGIPTIKPRENGKIIKQAKEALAYGVPAIAVDVDSAALINMTRLNQPVGPKTKDEIAELVQNIDVPLIIKGVMTVEDAISCKDAGAAAIVVSNHGGRVLDYTPGTAAVLSDIAEAVGDDMIVLVDGGVRSGTDVLKMLGLGAKGVLIGRPFTQAAAGGREGVAFLMQKIAAELKVAMIMTGTSDIKSIDQSIIY